jgi:succinoglycan biosynthesis transport protein ExoP
MFGPDSQNEGGGRRSLLDMTDDRSHPPGGGSCSFSRILEKSGLFGDDGQDSEVEHLTSRLAALHRLRAVVAADEALTRDDNQMAAARPRRPSPAAHEVFNGPPPQRPSAGSAVNPGRAPLAPSLRRNWRSVVLSALLGGLIGLGFALSAPNTYPAVSQLVLNPRELHQSNPEFAAKAPSDRIHRILVGRQVAVVGSAPVLQKVISDLNLDVDPEFNGMGNGGGIAQFFSGLFNLSESGAPGDRAAVARQSLARALTVTRGDEDYVVDVAVVTEDPAKSALIANHVAEAYLTLRSTPQSAPVAGSSEQDHRLEALRLDAEAARKRVQQYRADNGMAGADGDSAQRIADLAGQLAQIRAQKETIRETALSAARLDPDQLLSGPLPPIVESTNLGKLQVRYQDAKRTAEQLTTSLGAGDPRRVSAEQALAAARTMFARELRRFIAASQGSLRRVIETEQQLASELTILRNRSPAGPEELARLRALEEAASEAAQNYESYKELVPVSRGRASAGIGVMTPAMPVQEPTGPSGIAYTATGMAAGLAAGLVIAVIPAAFRRRRTRPARPMSPRPVPSAVTPAAEPVSPADDSAILDDAEDPAVEKETASDRLAEATAIVEEAENIHAEIRRIRNKLKENQQTSKFKWPSRFS